MPPGTRDQAVDEDDLEVERVAFDCQRPGFDLLRAAALLPRVERRAPDVDAVVRAVDAWSAEVRGELSKHPTWQGPLHALVNVLFNRAKLRGDEDEYDHPRNSFLDDVIARRRGLPISLSLIVTETAKRAGLVACGLALPRHFMAGVMLQRDPDRPDDADGADLFFVDAYHAQIIAPEDVAQRAGLPLEELAEHLAPAPPDVILARMLTNLRGSYLRRQDAQSCLRVLSRLLLLKPREAALHLESAHLRHALGDDGGALTDAEKGLSLARDPEEKEAAERTLDKLTRASGWVH